MNVAQARPRIWTPQVIVLSILVHVLVLYYAIVAFNIVPPFVPTADEPRTIPTIRIQPPPPVLPDPDPIVEKRPIFQQRPTNPPPINVTVPPSPLQPTPVPLQGPATVLVGKPIPEEPVAQGLPRYPVAAIERNIEGRVVMSITILPDGSVRDVQVVSAKPGKYFEAPAVRAVQTWRYRPSNVTRINVIVFMDFELRDG